MTKENMTDDRLFVLIEAYGAEPGAWPEDERAAAERLLASDPSRFASALEDARALDLVIEQDAMIEPPAGLAERLLADAPTAPKQRGGILQSLADIIMPNGVRWPAGAALAIRQRLRRRLIPTRQKLRKLYIARSAMMRLKPIWMKR